MDVFSTAEMHAKALLRVESWIESLFWSSCTTAVMPGLHWGNTESQKQSYTLLDAELIQIFWSNILVAFLQGEERIWQLCTGKELFRRGTCTQVEGIPRCSLPATTTSLGDLEKGRENPHGQGYKVTYGIITSHQSKFVKSLHRSVCARVLVSLSLRRNSREYTLLRFLYYSRLFLRAS